MRKYETLILTAVTTAITVFWDVRYCSLVHGLLAFQRNLLPISSGYMMVAVCSSSTLTPIYQIKWN